MSLFLIKHHEEIAEEAGERDRGLKGKRIESHQLYHLSGLVLLLKVWSLPERKFPAPVEIVSCMCMWFFLVCDFCSFDCVFSVLFLSLGNFLQSKIVILRVSQVTYCTVVL